jgi:hypothetical protein
MFLPVGGRSGRPSARSGLWQEQASFPGGKKIYRAFAGKIKFLANESSKRKVV